MNYFCKRSIIAFYEFVLPSETGLYEAGYADLYNRKPFKNMLPKGITVWEQLGFMRNRVDHPIDRKTKSHAKKITVQEAEFFDKQLLVALQEMFNVWLSSPPPCATTTAVSVTTTLTP
ncbi:hypothetical protein NIES4106_05340 [Fischerella sp. NIES-4106]|nr:hypothetical protein NIES4106_05340 [Fischerella sp. NIES-4106]